MDEIKPNRNFQLFVLNAMQNSVITHYVYTPVDLIQEFKNAKFEQKNWIVWDKGIVRADAIIGIIEN
jgi:hypothetical protein